MKKAMNKTIKKTMKDIFVSTVISIGAAMTIFCIVGIVFDVSLGGTFRLDDYRFTKMVIGCVLVGLGFGVPSVVYKKDDLPMLLRVLIHMGIGCVVYTIVAFRVGWIGGSATASQGAAIVCIQVAVVLLVWFLFYFHNKKEAERMNERLGEINR